MGLLPDVYSFIWAAEENYIIIIYIFILVQIWRLSEEETCRSNLCFLNVQHTELLCYELLRKFVGLYLRCSVR